MSCEVNAPDVADARRTARGSGAFAVPCMVADGEHGFC